MALDSKGKRQFEEARKLVHRGADGDKQAAAAAHEKLQKLIAADPHDALIKAYYGSALALLARDATKPLEKADLAQEGLDALHEAVAMNPADKEIRLLRANVCVRLPESFFYSSATAIEDFQYLLDRLQEEPNALTPKQVREILQNLSTAYQNVGKPKEAKEVLDRLDRMKKK